MTKPKKLYHGSGRELIGDSLIPNKANDLGENPDYTLNGIYATDLKEMALAMGILNCKGVKSSSCGTYGSSENPEVITIIYQSWPNQEFFYLYTLSSLEFENRPTGSHTYVSLNPIKPLKIESFPVKDYLHLVRKATKEEFEEWSRKYSDKIT